ncbi:MAG: trimethylamine methyltransferase family protein, partial [Pseudomonadota bacterium]
MKTARKARRRGNASSRDETEIRAPFITRKLGTFSVLGEEGLSLIEANADRILAQTGMEFHDDPACL